MFLPLIHNSAHVLEFDSLRELLRGYSSSPLGNAKIAALAPSADSSWIAEQQELAEEVREFRRVGGRFDFSGLLDVTSLIERARIVGAVLETTEIRDVVLIVDRAAEWREIVSQPPASMPTEWKRTRTLSASVPDFTEFLRYFRNKIEPDGTLEDRASPELARIRRDIEKQRRGIQDSLRAYLRRLAEGGAVQDELITIRGERFVIPVKIEQKRRVQGVVHGASSSGQTVYVEPLETIELNNELVRLLEDEQAEIQRIFAAMTRQIAQYAGVIQKGAEVLCEVDSLLARAGFAAEFQCVRPGFSGAGGPQLVLKAARHPLLERRLRAENGRIVPVSISLTGELRQVVISGPNTGGKSVSLKTVGLLAVMAQSGVPVPAEGAVFPLCDAFLADIGDAQSIEQNLSTFSAHVTNVNRIARRAD